MAANAAETIAIWEALAARGEEDKLPPEMRKAFDEARRIGLVRDTRGFVSRSISPRRDDLPEYPIGDGTIEGALEAERKAVQSGLVKSSVEPRIGSDSYGNPIIITERGSFYPNKPGASVGDLTRGASAVGGVIKEAAPYIAAGGATAPARALIGSAAQGVTGLISEGLEQTGKAITGEKTDLTQLWKTPILAMAGDILGRGAASLVSSVFTKVKGTKPDFKVLNEADGTLTEEAIKKLDDSGITPEDFDNIAEFELAKLSRAGALTKEEADRYNFFKSQGLEPTQAQVTRTADDFQTQQELAKRSTGVRNALEQQEAALTGAFDNKIAAAGVLESEGSPISNAVLSKATALDSEISRLYQEARAALPPESNIRLGRFFDSLRAKAPSNQASGGVISAIRGYLKDAGMQGGTSTVIGASGLPARVSTASPVSVGKAEALRIELNRLYGNANKEGRAIIRSLKDAIDEDVLKTAGQDFFAQARKAKTEFESGLSPQSLSKFDTNEASLVRDILDNSIKSDDVFNQVVLSRSWKPSDIKDLKSYLTSGSDAQRELGATAWSDLRAQTIQWIKENSFKGPVDAAGNQAISRAGLESSIRRIGRPRLETILSKEEVSFLDDMVKLSRLREPVRGTAMGRGPSAQAIKLLEDKASKLPLVGEILDAIKLSRQTESVVNPAKRSIEILGRPERINVDRRPYTATAGGLSSFVDME